MLPDEIYFATVEELSARIRRREISPVELAEGYMRRLEDQGVKLGALATLMRESGLREARQAESEIRRGRYRGPLHGVPYGAKDLLATREAPTTWGAAPFKNQRFAFDAAVVERLRAAGAVLIAKLSMVELAGGMGYNRADASWTGACLTPWNTKFWSGGSSSGPGAAVAAGLVGFAIGSETSGSIITPSAFCGITGLRPTYGAVSRRGAMALAWTLDKLGPMCRSAWDCGAVLSAIAGRDPLDPSTKDFKLAFPSKRKFTRTTLPVAVMKDSYDKAQPEVKENFLRSVETLRKFADVVMDVPLPDFPYGPAVGTIVDGEGGSAFRELIESGGLKELDNANDRVGGYSASLVTAVDYLHAMRMRVPMRRAWNEMFKKYSFIVAPARSTVAYPADKNFEDAYPGITASSPIGASNLVGAPGISLPNGFGQNNLPTGLQIIGPAWSESLLLDAAVAYQNATDFHKKHP